MVFALIVVLATANKFTVAQQEPNVGAILNNQYVLNGYIKCVLDQGPCNKMGKDLKGELHSMAFAMIICHDNFL